MDGIQVPVIKLHIPHVVLHIDELRADIHGDESVCGRLGVRGQEKGKCTQLRPVVTVTGLRITGGTAEDEVSIVVVVVSQTVVVAVEHDAIVLLDNANQGCEVGLVGRRRDVGVMQLEKFPVGLGRGKCI